MVELPAPTIVMTLPAIVTTSVFELVYENGALLFVDGALMVDGELPNTFTGIVNVPRTVVA